MFIPKIIPIEAHPKGNYILHLKFADGVEGDVDLSHLAGKGVFTFWDQYENFRKVSVFNGRWLAWSDEIDLDADSFYLQVTGMTPAELFPLIKENPSYT